MGAATVHEFKDTQAFKDFIAKNEFVVIDFSATWCGPCKLISPKFTKLSEEHPEVKFVKIDVDDMNEIAQVYGVSAMPTFNIHIPTTVQDTNMGESKVHMFKDSKSFNDFIKEKKNMVINFSSAQRESSTQINPTFAKLSEEYPRITFVQLDVDDVDMLTLGFDLDEIPSFYFFNNSKSDGVIYGGHSDLLTRRVEAFYENIQYTQGSETPDWAK
ncbi:thioredoxin trx1 [Coemansia sp. RSA 530]|nr:thioredoxin trx1 [Coemansia sp. RSA 530]